MLVVLCLTPGDTDGYRVCFIRSPLNILGGNGGGKENLD